MHQNFLLNKHLIQSELVTMMGRERRTGKKEIPSAPGTVKSLMLLLMHTIFF